MDQGMGRSNLARAVVGLLWLLVAGVMPATGQTGITEHQAVIITGAAIFNEAGADIDFRMEGDTEVNLFFLDASTDRIGIGTASPQGALEVQGAGETSVYVNSAAASIANVRFQENSVDRWAIGNDDSNSDNFYLYSFQKSGGADRVVSVEADGNVGIGTTTPGLGGLTGASLTLEHATAAKAVEFSTTSDSLGATDLGYISWFAGSGNNENVRIVGQNLGTQENAGELIFYTRLQGSALAEAMRIDTNSNVGIAVTPDTNWWSGDAALQIGGMGVVYATASAAAGNEFAVGNNFVQRSATDNYIVTDEASQYRQANGTHAWKYAASGTAGNAITFSTGLFQDVSGNVGMGTTGPADALEIDVDDSVHSGVSVVANGASNRDPLFKLSDSGRTWNIRMDRDDSDKFVIDTTTTGTVVTIDSSGNVTLAAGLICTTCVNTTDIATSTGSVATAGGCSGTGCLVSMNDYAFFPKVEADDCATNNTDPPSMHIRDTNAANDTVGYFALVNNGASCTSGTMDVRWRYITASDRGRIWVAVNDITGDIVAVWESDDPANQSDPLDASVPIEMPGATTFNVLIPNMGQIQALMQALDVDQRGRARAALVSKLNGRGWTTGAVDESSLTSVPARYQDSARLAGLRVVADELGIVPAELVFEFMNFLMGPERVQWKANLGNVIDAHMVARSQ